MTPIGRRASALSVVFVMTIAGALSVHAAGPMSTVSAAPSEALGSRHHQARPSAASALDDRVQLLAKELDLDGPQEAAVKKILEYQREQVAKVWSDAAVPAAYRVSATRAIGESTAEQIRHILTEEQRGKYSTARQSHAATSNAPQTSVEDWMKRASSE